MVFASEETLAVRRAALDIFLTFECHGQDHFTAELLRLLQKSDPQNKWKLRLGFPVVVDALEEWNNSVPKEFYEKYGVYPLLHPKSDGRKIYENEYGKPSKLKAEILDVSADRVGEADEP